MLADFFGRIKHLVIKEIIVVLREPKSRFIIVFPPLLQLVMFSYVATQEVINSKIGILNNDNGKYSTEIIRRIQGSPRYFKEIVMLEGKDQIEYAIDNAKVSSVLEFSNNFSANITSGKEAEVSLLFDGRQMNSATLLSGYLQEIIASSVSEKTNAGRKSNALRPNVTIRHWFNPTLDFKWFMMPALLGLLLGSSLLTVASLSVAREKEMGTFEQITVSPLTPTEIVIGKTISCLCIGLIQSTVLLVAVAFIGIPFTSKYIYLFAAIVLYCVTLISMGISVSSICTTQQQAVLGIFVLSTPMMMTAGFSSPFKSMPEGFQVASYLFNPIYHFLCISRGLFLKNSSLLSLADHFGMLAAIMCISTYISIIFFKSRLP